ncbi:response regulator transcription factor [Bacteroides finegoldii]|jgi:two-component system response regulator NreC|uniref:Response regulator transcription factor n=2 Tax=Bacteroides finegoldii TaxID=338188 RepID=A0A174HCT0_9BACE|nr:response regulator transcription factor [Bacteroides finegoldii]CDC50985.1 transcriptional regulator LuxR family [Bacteroides finegoldii CAG:203]EEX45742.1 transcriptional regulator, LuxR family [Bacteroides finegoldii DSM 17565]KAA5217231.1 response regulator transcription factor [Bacteroides finegoldii]KAA5220634.1 response regulator transcription factor [Bacteroides finegoldii]KAA5226798.1 response regulator transcription factor [Bacteroides finegoldii]
MKNNEVIRIAIAETSVIIRGGLTAALKRLPNVKVQPIELLSIEALHDCVRTQCPDMLIVNPAFGDYFDIGKFREETSGKKIRVIALVTSFVDASLLSKYDESISIFDDLERLSKKISGLLNVPSEEEDLENQDALSQREKEIVICVVKGMTNKEIAEKLFLSIHTVITHRRNISKKLQIHSAAGLTIYAIVNKLVTLNDVKGL